MKPKDFATEGGAIPRSSGPLKILRFGKHYPKLEQQFFNTIRLKTDLKEGDRVSIVSPFLNFLARVDSVKKVRLNMIRKSTLIWDTHTHTRGEALDELREYYPGLNWEDKVYLIGLVKED